MTKKEFNEIILCKQKIRTLTAQIQELEVYATTIKSFDYSADRVQTSASNTIEDTVIKLIDMQKMLQKRIDELVEMKVSAAKEINKLEGKYYLVMSLRYLECLNWEWVARRMGHSIQHVYRLHGQALNILKENGACD